MELLTKNSIVAIYNDQWKTDPQWAQPVLQILHLRKLPAQAQVAPGQEPQDRYRFVLSDGSRFMQAMVTSHINEFILNGTFVKDCLIRVKTYSVNVTNGRKIFIILDAELVSPPPASGKIGDPVTIESEEVKPANYHKPPSSAAVAPPPAAQSYAPPPQQQQQRPPQSYAPPAQQQRSFAQPAAQKASSPSNNDYQQQSFSAGRSAPSSSASNIAVMPIKTLNPYQNKWTIRARVSNKSEWRTWTNAKGDGKLFSVTFMDESGEIKATAFNDVAERLYPLMEENKVYYVTRASIKIAKKQWSNVQNDYEITFEKDSEITPCHDAGAVPAVRYNFVTIDKLYDHQKDSVIDFIGVVKEVGDVTTIVTKATQKQLSKRDVTMVDMTNNSVSLTLWGKLADSFEAREPNVVAFKGVRVGDYNGRTLSTSGSTTVSINPEISECFKLRGWYDEMGRNTEMTTVSNAPSKRTGAVSAERKFLSSIVNENLGQNEKPDYLTVKATTSQLKSDRSMWYTACPGENCKKKVVEEGPNTWRCEKCARTYPYCDYKYIMTINVMDHTGTGWFQAFDEIGNQLLGHSASDLNQLKENNNTEAFQAVFSAASFKTYLFRIKVKQELYNGEQKIRSSIMSVEPIDYAQESHYLADHIQQLTAA